MVASLYKEYQRWSERGSIFIFSDSHIDDFDCKLMNPNWITPEEQFKILKKVCTKNDTLILLGDVGDPTRFNEIKAHKVLIKGNHDAGTSIYEPYFDEIYEGALIIGEKIILSHEPIIGLPYMVNLHGHVHNGAHEWTDECGGRHVNFAADVIGYKPINLGKLIKNGLLANTPSIHRLTIDRATERKLEKIQKI